MVKHDRFKACWKQIIIIKWSLWAHTCVVKLHPPVPSTILQLVVIFIQWCSKNWQLTNVIFNIRHPVRLLYILHYRKLTLLIKARVSKGFSHPKMLTLSFIIWNSFFTRPAAWLQRLFCWSRQAVVNTIRLSSLSPRAVEALYPAIAFLTGD